MRIARRTLAIGATLIVAAVTATGCGQSIEDAEAALCADLASLRASVQTMSETTDDTTIAELKQRQTDLKTAWRDVTSSFANLDRDRATAFDDAWEDFVDTVEDVDGDTTIGEANAELVTAAGTFRDAVTEAARAVDCSN